MEKVCIIEKVSQYVWVQIHVLEVLLYLFEVVAVIVVGYTSSIAGVV